MHVDFEMSIVQDYLICYILKGEKYNITIRAHLSDLNERNIFAVLSHETIEYLLAKLELETEHLLDIHTLIGGNPDWYDKVISDKDWENNLDGLPNLDLKSS